MSDTQALRSCRRLNKSTPGRSSKVMRSDIETPVFDVINALVRGYHKKVINGQQQKKSRSLLQNRYIESIEKCRPISARSISNNNSITCSSAQSVPSLNTESKQNPRDIGTKHKATKTLSTNVGNELTTALSKIPRYYSTNNNKSRKKLRIVKYTFSKLCQHVNELIYASRSTNMSSKNTLPSKSKSVNPSKSKTKTLRIRGSKSVKKQKSKASTSSNKNEKEKEDEKELASVTNDDVEDITARGRDIKYDCADPENTGRKATLRADGRRRSSKSEVPFPKPFPRRPVIATEKRKGAYFTPFGPITGTRHVKMDSFGVATTKAGSLGPCGATNCERFLNQDDRRGSSSLDECKIQSNCRRSAGICRTPASAKYQYADYSVKKLSTRPSSSPASSSFEMSSTTTPRTPTWRTPAPHWATSWGMNGSLTEPSTSAVRSSTGSTIASNPGEVTQPMQESATMDSSAPNDPYTDVPPPTPTSNNKLR